MVKGQLVRVHGRSALEQQKIKLHGELWVTTSPVMSDGFIWCRSLATGSNFDWHHTDLTTQEDTEPTKEEPTKEEPTTC